MPTRAQTIYKEGVTQYLFVDSENLNLDYNTICSKPHAYFSDLCNKDFTNSIIVTYHSRSGNRLLSLKEIAEIEDDFFHFDIKPKKNHEVVDQAIIMDVLSVASKTNIRRPSTPINICIFSNDDDYYELVGNLVFNGINGILITNNDIMRDSWQLNNGFEYILIEPINHKFRTSQGKIRVEEFWLQKASAKIGRDHRSMTEQEILDLLKRPEPQPEELMNMAPQVEVSQFDKDDSSVDSVNTQVAIVQSKPSPSRASILKKAKSMVQWNSSVKAPSQEIKVENLSVDTWKKHVTSTVPMFGGKHVYSESFKYNITIYDYAQMANVITLVSHAPDGRKTRQKFIRQTLIFLVKSKIISPVVVTKLIGSNPHHVRNCISVDELNYQLSKEPYFQLHVGNYPS